MTDEKFLFISDVRDKAVTARSSHNRRTHAGKSGSCKLPSDYLTKKEREKMNGETTTYRISEPMKWEEFKALPDDLKILHISWIREKFGAPNTAIAKMLGVHQTSLSMLLKKLGVSTIENFRNPHRQWDKQGFEQFAGISDCSGSERNKENDDCNPNIPEETCKKQDNPVPVVESVHPTTLIPAEGRMDFYGNASEALQTALNVLCNAKVHLCISWGPIRLEDTKDGGR